MADNIRYFEVFKQINCKNPISGHEWTEDGKSLGWECHGGYFAASHHKTEAKAREEAEWRKAFNKKHPWSPPRSKREIEKAKRLKLI